MTECSYEALLQRDEVSLNILRLKDESLEDSANLPDPDVIAAEIAEDLRVALEQFEVIAGDLNGTANPASEGQGRQRNSTAPLTSPKTRSGATASRMPPSGAAGPPSDVRCPHLWIAAS